MGIVHRRAGIDLGKVGILKQIAPDKIQRLPTPASTVMLSGVADRGFHNFE
jgi:hypothetical protein